MSWRPATAFRNYVAIADHGSGPLTRGALGIMAASANRGEKKAQSHPPPDGYLFLGFVGGRRRRRRTQTTTTSQAGKADRPGKRVRFVGRTWEDGMPTTNIARRRRSRDAREDDLVSFLTPLPPFFLLFALFGAF